MMLRSERSYTGWELGVGDPLGKAAWPFFRKFNSFPVTHAANFMAGELHHNKIDSGIQISQVL